MWWYFDHLDASGTGCVCILSYALPFLPGITSGARKGAGFVPEQIPSLNVAVYVERQLVDYYLITGSESRARYEFHEDAGRLVERLSFAESTLTIERDDTRTSFYADLRLPVAGQANARTRLNIRAEGPTVRTGTDESGVRLPRKEPHATPQKPAKDDVHRWAMICPNLSVDASIDWPDGRHLTMSGHGYLDRNDSMVAIDQLGIDWWLWGRARVNDVVYVWYVLEGHESATPTKAIGFEVQSDGAVVQRELVIQQADSRRRLFGMRRSSHYTLLTENRTWLELTEQSVVDDGPFYLRTIQLASTSGGDSGLGFCELVRPARVDLARHRFLVRMRVLNLDQRTSIWLPLFSGPAGTRWRRLFRGWAERLRPSKRLPRQRPPAGRLE